MLVACGLTYDRYVLPAITLYHVADDVHPADLRGTQQNGGSAACTEYACMGQASLSDMQVCRSLGLQTARGSRGCGVPEA